MASRDPLLPNAWVVARREFRDRVRGPLYLASTIVLAGLAMLVAMAPVAVRYVDRQTVSRIAVVASDADLADRTVGVADSVLNTRPPGADATWQKPYQFDRVADAGTANAQLASGRLTGMLLVDRADGGQVRIVYRSNDSPGSSRAQLLELAAFGIGVIDWSSRLSTTGASGVAPFVQAAFEAEQLNVATEAGRTLGAQEVASRGFLGIVFVVLLFITVVIYGMWVATGVASEKSSRVMELMVSAASPRQLLTGKVLGIGAAGLTQYLAIAIPTLLVIAFQDRIAGALLGPGGMQGTAITGLSPGLLLAYGVFFLLGFSLFALIYAAMGSFVSRPDDLQTLSLPLSLLATAGYLTAVVALGGGQGVWVTIASFLPPFSPFVMLARLMVSAVAPWEVALSVGILVAAIAVVAVVASRMYAAGVLLYGQRPGLRAFVAAARRA
jgi:ABC-2 type transport system permease protein